MSAFDIFRRFAHGLKDIGATKAELAAVAAAITRAVVSMSHSHIDTTDVADCQPSVLMKVPVELAPNLYAQMASLQKHHENNQLSGRIHHFAAHAACATLPTMGSRHVSESMRIKRRADRLRHFQPGRSKRQWMEVSAPSVSIDVEQVVDIPVPMTQEEVVLVPKVFTQERAQHQHDDVDVDVPVPMTHEEVVHFPKGFTQERAQHLTDVVFVLVEVDVPMTVPMTLEEVVHVPNGVSQEHAQHHHVEASSPGTGGSDTHTVLTCGMVEHTSGNRNTDAHSIDIDNLAFAVGDRFHRLGPRGSFVPFSIIRDDRHRYGWRVQDEADFGSQRGAHYTDSELRQRIRSGCFLLLR